MKINRFPQMLMYGVLAILGLAIAMRIVTAKSPTKKVAATAKAKPQKATKGQQTATLAGGCFWSMEAMFGKLKGVQSVHSGYSGGQTQNPTYEEVGSGTTGHAEAINIVYDPKVISYRDLLTVFFTMHNPTTADRQGADEGTQYRSMVLFHNAAQEKIAREVIVKFNADKVWDAPIVTQVEPFKSFTRAEDYHLNYFAQNGGNSYCRAVIVPKMEKLRAKFGDKLKS